MNPITLRAVLHRGLKGTHVLTSCLALAATATLLLSAHGQPASPSPTPYTPVLSIGGTLAQLNSEVLLSLKNVAPTDRAATLAAWVANLTKAGASATDQMRAPYVVAAAAAAFPDTAHAMIAAAIGGNAAYGAAIVQAATQVQGLAPAVVGTAPALPNNTTPIPLSPLDAASRPDPAVARQFTGAAAFNNQVKSGAIAVDQINTEIVKALNNLAPDARAIVADTYLSAAQQANPQGFAQTLTAVLTAFPSQSSALVSQAISVIGNATTAPGQITAIVAAALAIPGANASAIIAGAVQGAASLTGGGAVNTTEQAFTAIMQAATPAATAAGLSLTTLIQTALNSASAAFGPGPAATPLLTDMVKAIVQTASGSAATETAAIQTIATVIDQTQPAQMSAAIAAAVTVADRTGVLSVQNLVEIAANAAPRETVAIAQGALQTSPAATTAVLQGIAAAHPAAAAAIQSALQNANGAITAQQALNTLNQIATTQNLFPTGPTTAAQNSTPPPSTPPPQNANTTDAGTTPATTTQTGTIPVDYSKP